MDRSRLHFCSQGLLFHRVMPHTLLCIFRFVRSWHSVVCKGCHRERRFKLHILWSERQCRIQSYIRLFRGAGRAGRWHRNPLQSLVGGVLTDGAHDRLLKFWSTGSAIANHHCLAARFGLLGKLRGGGFLWEKKSGRGLHLQPATFAP